MKIELYSKIQLKTGEIADVVEILEPNKAYIVDVYEEDGEFRTEEIAQDEIKGVFVETLIPLAG